jgi:hypothetical protein
MEHPYAQMQSVKAHYIKSPLRRRMALDLLKTIILFGVKGRKPSEQDVRMC